MALQSGNYIVDTDIDNWAGGATDAQKLAAIQAAENLIEQVTKDFFYAKSFSVVRDGNGKGRLFLGFKSDILSITEVKVSTIVLASSLYAFNERAIFKAAVTGSQCKAIEGITLLGSDPVSINVTSHGFVTGETARLLLVVGISPSLDAEYVVTRTDADNYTLNGTDSSNYSGSFTSGTACFATLAELHYLTGSEEGTFPKGIANIEVTGTYGWASCPGGIKQATIILCRSANDETLYTKYEDLVSDKMGDATISRGQKEYLTGIQEADRLIRNYIRRSPSPCAI